LWDKKRAVVCGVRVGVCVAACHSDNVPKSMFGASAVTDEEFESGKVQPVCPDW